MCVCVCVFRDLFGIGVRTIEKTKRRQKKKKRTSRSRSKKKKKKNADRFFFNHRKQNKENKNALLLVVKLTAPFSFVRSNILWSSVRNLSRSRGAGIVDGEKEWKNEFFRSFFFSLLNLNDRKKK